MACCKNCEHGEGPCADNVGGVGAIVLAPRAVRPPLRRTISVRPRTIGALSDPIPSAGGISVSQGVGAVAGGWGGWALAGMVGRNNLVVKLLGALAGGYLGSQVVPAATNAAGI